MTGWYPARSIHRNFHLPTKTRILLFSEAVLKEALPFCHSCCLFLPLLIFTMDLSGYMLLKRYNLQSEYSVAKTAALSCDLF